MRGANLDKYVKQQTVKCCKWLLVAVHNREAPMAPSSRAAADTHSLFFLLRAAWQLLAHEQDFQGDFAASDFSIGRAPPVS